MYVMWIVTIDTVHTVINSVLVHLYVDVFVYLFICMYRAKPYHHLSLLVFLHPLVMYTSTE